MLSGRVGRGRTKRSHFIFEKASGKLIDKAVGVKPANECVFTKPCLTVEKAFPLTFLLVLTSSASSANALDFIKKHHA